MQDTPKRNRKPTRWWNTGLRAVGVLCVPWGYMTEQAPLLSYDLASTTRLDLATAARSFYAALYTASSI